MKASVHHLAIVVGLLSFQCLAAAPPGKPDCDAIKDSGAQLACMDANADCSTPQWLSGAARSACISQEAATPPPKPSPKFTQIGNLDCGRWFTEPYRRSAKTWLMGHLSGMNTLNFVLGGKDALAKLGSGDQAALWMDNYCKTNPLDRLSDGSLKLFTELLNRASAN